MFSSLGFYFLIIILEWILWHESYPFWHSSVLHCTLFKILLPWSNGIWYNFNLCAALHLNKEVVSFEFVHSLITHILRWNLLGGDFEHSGPVSQKAFGTPVFSLFNTSKRFVPVYENCLITGTWVCCLISRKRNWNLYQQSVHLFELIQRKHSVE